MFGNYKVADQHMFITFRGATMTVDDDGRVEYTPRDDVIINVAQICAIYDHTIIVMGHKIRVMETFEDIKVKLSRLRR